MILADKDGNVKVDGKVRTDSGYPVGLQDVITIDKTKENYRVLYDVQGKFILKSIKPEEVKLKLVKVTLKKIVGQIMFRTLSSVMPEPNDILIQKFIIKKVLEFLKEEPGNLCYIIGGNNIGRVGLIQHREKHLRSFDIVHVKDSNGKHLSTRINNIFSIGKGKKSLISLPDDNSLYLTALEKNKSKITRKLKNNDDSLKYISRIQNYISDHLFVLFYHQLKSIYKLKLIIIYNIALHLLYRMTNRSFLNLSKMSFILLNMLK